MLFQEDQADRADCSKLRDPGYLAEMGKRNQQRREKVLEILAKTDDKADFDFYHATMIFNHGIEVKDARHHHQPQQLAPEGCQPPAAREQKMA
ncbi:MAG: hypothetical protein JNM52_00845 [Betaproteobacteria bacterium]|nr:hypothetical protein [Betaproteobacteria bacterium]